MNSKQLISITAAAQFLNRSVVTLRRWHKAGKLHPHFVLSNGSRVYNLNKLREFRRKMKD